MFRGLLLLALAAAAAWLAYRRSRPPHHAAPFDAAFPRQPVQIPSSSPLADTPTPVDDTPTPAADAPAEPSAAFEAYCMRCKVHRPIMDQQIEVTPSGRRAAKGSCPVCGAKLNRFLPSL